MSVTELYQKCHGLAGLSPDTALEPDSLVGFFQLFRPDGNGLQDVFSDVTSGHELHERLLTLYQSAGEDRRPAGGRDAYFVVRSPRQLDPDRAAQLGIEWLEGLVAIASRLQVHSFCNRFQPLPRIRVLEGIAPKHPRDDSEKSELLLAIQQLSRQIETIDAGPHAAALRPAYYFTACDPMLRDYLMWPLYATTIGLGDPLSPYFELWRHGVKYRIFGESQIDLYLPRSAGQPDRQGLLISMSRDAWRLVDLIGEARFQVSRWPSGHG